MTTTDLTTAEQVSGLREAAAAIAATVGLVRIDEQIVLTAALAKPIHYSLLAAADRIEANGSALGLPVSYDLEIAGVILGRDLGHNR